MERLSACILRLLIGTTTPALSRIDAETPRQVPREREERERDEERREEVLRKIEAAGALLCSCCSRADGRVIVSYER